MTEEEKAEARRRALPAIIEFRDRGCVLAAGAVRTSSSTR